MAPQTLRECRELLGLTQRGFADRLRVSTETYRVWESGRRAAPERIRSLARALVAALTEHDRLPLAVAAALIGVHVRTLWSAARGGRLEVTYDGRTTFRNLRAETTRAHAEAFKRKYYRTRRQPELRKQLLSWSDVPADYDAQIRTLRCALGKSLAEFAAAVGAARKAVVYQWEARKRCPSPVFWLRIKNLQEQSGFAR